MVTVFKLFSTRAEIVCAGREREGCGEISSNYVCVCVCVKFLQPSSPILRLPQASSAARWGVIYALWASVKGKAFLRLVKHLWDGAVRCGRHSLNLSTCTGGSKSHTQHFTPDLTRGSKGKKNQPNNNWSSSYKGITLFVQHFIVLYSV